MKPRRFHLRCPTCTHEFWRRMTLKGTTSCPKCAAVFPRRPAVSSISATLLANVIAHEERLKRNAQVMGKGSGLAIRGLQVPDSLTEAKFKGRCRENGWIAHRPSWPDFVVERQGLPPIAVETKSAQDPISSAQRRTFDLLEKMGVKVYLWRDRAASRELLTRWPAYRDRRLARISKRKANKQLRSRLANQPGATGTDVTRLKEGHGPASVC